MSDLARDDSRTCAWPQPNGGCPSFRLYDPARPEDLPEALLVAYGAIGELLWLLGGSLSVTKAQAEAWAAGRIRPFAIGNPTPDEIILTPVKTGTGS